MLRAAPLIRYLSLRVLQAVIVVWLAYTVTFVAMQFLPSDPITVMLSSDTAVDPLVIEQMKSYYGFDQPPIVQYGTQLLNLLSGNFGYSIASGQTVDERIGSVISGTLALSGLALLFATIISAVIVSVVNLSGWGAFSRWFANLPPLFSAIPTFWLGLVVLQVFSVQLRWISLFPDGSALSLVVPALVLGIPISAPIAQVYLKSIETVLAQPFVGVVRAKGGSRSWVFFRHVLKSGAGPALTVLGLTTGHLLAGSVIVETVFSRAGLGRILLDAVNTQDIAMVQGLVLLAAVVFVAINLVIDLLYPLLDPRILAEGLRSKKAGIA